MASLALGVKRQRERNGIVSTGCGMAFGAGLSITAGVIAQSVKIMVAAKAFELIGVADMRERYDRPLQPGRVTIGKQYHIVLGGQRQRYSRKASCHEKHDHPQPENCHYRILHWHCLPIQLFCFLNLSGKIIISRISSLKDVTWTPSSYSSLRSDTWSKQLWQGAITTSAFVARI